MAFLSPENESVAINQVSAPFGRRAAAVAVGSLLLITASCGGDKPSSEATDSQASSSSSSSDSSTTPTSAPFEVPQTTEVPLPSPTVPYDGSSVPTTSPEQGAPISVEMQEFRLEEIFARPESVDQLQGLNLVAIVADGDGQFSVINGVGAVRFNPKDWVDGTVFTDWQDPSDDLTMALIVESDDTTFAITSDSAMAPPDTTEAGVVGIYMPRVGSSDLPSDGPPAFTDEGKFSSHQEARAQVLFLDDMYGDTVAPDYFNDALLPPQS